MTETALQEGVKEQLLSDYQKVNGEIAKILKNPEQNFFVYNFQYTTPTIVFGQSIPLDDAGGKFQYFLRIRNALEAALTTGRVPRAMVGTTIPRYLSDLVEK